MVKKKKNPKFVSMILSMKHSRAGQVYGPGRNIMVPFDLVREFQYEEQCAKVADERFSGTRAVLVLRGNRTKQIPVEAFDSGLIQEFDNPSHRTS